MKTLINELFDLYLRNSTEQSRQGIFHKLMPVIAGAKWIGNIDIDSYEVDRMRLIILELKKEVDKNV